jgi:Flp pilus assembly protein CpaB
MRGRLLILIGLIILVLVIGGFLLFNNVLNTAGDVANNVIDTALQGTPINDNVNATQAPTPTPIPLVEIVYALQNLPRGYRFPASIEEMENIVGYTPWPEAALPFNAIRRDQGGLELLINQIARTDISREQPILSNLLVEDLLSIAAVGSDAAAILPSDRVAVSMPMDRITSVAYAVQDGDRVDIILSMLFIDVDDTFQSITPNNITLITVSPENGTSFAGPFAGRIDNTGLGPAVIGPQERQRPRLATQRTIQDALVVHVGEFPLDGRFIGELPTPTPVPVTEEAADGGGNQTTPVPTITPVPPPNIITLGVTPQEAVAIVWAIDSRLPITLALRSVSDRSITSTSPVSLDYMLSQYNVSVPARRDYALEPAIRSIRQLLVGDIVDLGGSFSETPQQSGQN